MVAARHLQRGVEPMSAFSIPERGAVPVSTSSRHLKHCRVTLHPFQCRDDLEAMHSLFEKADVIIDALLGIGATGSLTEPLSTCVEMANASEAQIIAADVPTPGMRADRICAFHRAKIQGSTVVDIGIPLEAECCVGPGNSPFFLPGDIRHTKGLGGKCWLSAADRIRVHPILPGLVRCGQVRISSGSHHRSLNQFPI